MTHLNQDRFKAMLTKLNDRKFCSSTTKDNLMMLTYYNMLPSIKSPGCSQGQTRSMTQRYETQDANAEDCHIKNACKKHPYSARTPPEPTSATQASEIQNNTQRKSHWLAERQQTLAPQANEQPPKPKGKKRQRPSEYKHNNDISYCAVQPLDPEIRATSLWDYKKACIAGIFSDPSDAFN